MMLSLKIETLRTLAQPTQRRPGSQVVAKTQITAHITQSAHEELPVACMNTLFSSTRLSEGSSVFVHATYQCNNGTHKVVNLQG